MSLVNFDKLRAKELCDGDLQNQARLFAIERHGTQMRKYTGEMYWSHLADVASIVGIKGPYYEYHEAIVAWLHDVVEDTPTTIEEVEELFGVRVAQDVESLTDRLVAKDGNRAFRKNAYKDKIAQSSMSAHNVKVADLISNTSSIVEHDRGFARIYLEEKLALLKILTKAREDLRLQAFEILAEGFLTLLKG